MAKLTEEDHLLKSKIKIRMNNLLELKGLNQATYASEAYKDRQSVNRWFNENNMRGVSIYSINKFCKTINITLDIFFDDPLFQRNDLK
ncbi:helix-turn-helix domain-containing protein [Chryseobacterium sp.]|uniref:helix-turn-helix domain-containing protein n=1 Tax=Chryseobacterium sp. TaxID=1871047 RepID=UPI0011CAAE57|nr:helix-turn-helix transcriptional regulator [Chryseobacterium sp.]TXF78846.1 helix-turn-helix transcriptional regulator [Chryseobacterium sp.]